MLRFLAAAALSLLPRRTWPRYSEIGPIHAAAILSALVTIVAGIVFGGLGFLDFAEEAASGANDAMLDVASGQADGSIGGAPVSSSAPMFLSMFAALGYAIGTWSGRFASYLVLSGGVRAIAAMLDDPLGDPILTGLHHVATRWRDRRSDRRSREARESLEGTEAPDVLLPAERLSVEGATWVVLASRRKPGWERGVTVITDEGWFALGEPFDLPTPQGLRTAYPLAEPKETDVLRASVTYALPRGAGKETGRARTP